jgi:hypothetical protein
MKLLLCLVFVLAGVPAFAGLVTNGTFDSGCAGWSLSNTDGFTCSSTGGNPDSRLILNNGPGIEPSASQAIAGLILGGLYRITLDASSNYNCCNNATTPGAAVAIDSKQFFFLVTNNQPWTAYSFDFTYDGGSNVLVLSSQRQGTDSDAQFDNVDINLLEAPGSPVPEPASMLLVGCGLLAAAAAQRRGKLIR